MRCSTTADLKGWNRPLLFATPQPRCVDQQDDVGRAGRAFSLKPRQDAGVVGLDAV